MPPSIWPSDRQRVQRPADVLGGGDLHDPHQAELEVDVDDGAVGHEGERGVAVALPELVEVGGRAGGGTRAPPRTPGPAVASATATRRSPTVSTTASSSIASRSGSRPCCAADVLEEPLAHGPAGRRRPRRRTSTSGGTADVEPAEPIEVSIGSSTTSSTPRMRAGDLLGDRHEALAHLGGGELQRGHAVGQPAASGREVVEALGVHEVLDRHAPADAPHHVVGGRRCARRPRAGAAGRRRRPPTGSVGSGSAAVSRMHRATGATLSHDLAGDEPVAGLHGVAEPDLDRDRARTPRPAGPSGSRGRSRPAPPRSRAWHRTAGCWCAPRSPSTTALSHAYGPWVWVMALTSTADDVRGVGAAVEDEAGLDLHDPTVGGGVVAHPDGGRVAVDVAEEALVAAVLHLHRAARCAGPAGRRAPGG